MSAPSKKKAKAEWQLASKVDQFYAELAEMRSLLHKCGPATPAGEAGSSIPPVSMLVPEEDVFSLVASGVRYSIYWYRSDTK